MASSMAGKVSPPPRSGLTRLPGRMADGNSAYSRSSSPWAMCGGMVSLAGRLHSRATLLIVLRTNEVYALLGKLVEQTDQIGGVDRLGQEQLDPFGAGGLLDGLLGVAGEDGDVDVGV